MTLLPLDNILNANACNKLHVSFQASFIYVLCLQSCHLYPVIALQQSNGYRYDTVCFHFDQSKCVQRPQLT